MIKKSFFSKDKEALWLKLRFFINIHMMSLRKSIFILFLLFAFFINNVRQQQKEEVESMFD
jgi:hypothetical protein